MTKGQLLSVFCVGCGGFIGSIFRYLFSLLPLSGSFPLNTLITNFVGALFIGAIAESAVSMDIIPPNLLLFLKTGFCGGFTTFSTFSLETATLLERGNLALGSFYAASSVIICIIGIFLGKFIVRMIVIH